MIGAHRPSQDYLSTNHKSGRLGISTRDKEMSSCSEASQVCLTLCLRNQGRLNDVEASQFTSEQTAPSSQEKVKAAVFWDAKGVIFLNFLHQCYCKTLTKLRSAIRRKRLSAFSEGAVLLGNAKPHTVRLTQYQICRFGWKRLDHPAYSPDLAPSDFHLFPALKEAHSGRHFQHNGVVEQAVKQFFASQFYQSGLFKLIARFDYVSMSVATTPKNSARCIVYDSEVYFLEIKFLCEKITKLTFGTSFVLW